MKSLTLVKKTLDMQLGHLYEHIFIKTLQQTLKEQGWLSCLDYRVAGLTSEKGFIVLRIHAYHEKLALRIEKMVENLKIDFSEDEVAGAALQIFAEKMVDSVGFSEKTDKGLARLNHKKWQKLEDMGVDSGLKIPYDQYLNLDLVPPNQFHNIRLSLGFDGENSLLPLFLVLGKIIENNVAELIEDEQHSFLTKMDFDEENCLFVSEFRRSKRQEVSEKAEIEVVKEVINTLKQTDQLEKIVEAGQKSFCMDDEWVSTPIEVLTRSSCLVGGKGWQELANVENILTVLDKMSVKIDLV